MRRKLLAALILLWCFSLQVNAQTRIIKGKVVNETDGTGIPGASILVTGTRTTTQTDQSGNYTIAVTGPGAKSLRFTYVGFVAKVVPITGSTINVNLKEDSEALDEIAGAAGLVLADVHRPNVGAGLPAKAT